MICWFNLFAVSIIYYLYNFLCYQNSETTSMSISTVNAVGTKISTRIRQAGFDIRDVEALMYMGEETVPMFTHALKRSTWGQIFWSHLGGIAGERIEEQLFSINGLGSNSLNSMDYLLALAVEAVFPRVTLVNTPAPIPFTISFLSDDIIDPSVDDIVEAGQSLYYYLSDGTAGLPALQVFVGTLAALTNSRGSGGLGIPRADVRPFASYSPRHRVGWGDHAVLAAIESATFLIDGVEYEELSKHAIYNALQFRMREDVYPVAGHEATSLDAVLLPAGIGAGSRVVLGDSEDERYRAFILPHSFTTSALADRGENGKHKSAFPILLACKNLIQERLTLVDDVRTLLVLEEEVLPDYCNLPVTFVATPTELAVDADGNPTNNVFITDGVQVFEVLAEGFVPGTVDGLEDLVGPFTTAGNFVVRLDGRNITFGPGAPFRIENLGCVHLECTGEYLPVTRPTDYACENPFSREFDYAAWIVEENLGISVRLKALGALVTDLERGMMKADCRGKKWMYERYSYFDSNGTRPGDRFSVCIDETPGQTKYAYTFAQNELSRLQGHHFNYTNDTDYKIIIDEDLARPKWVFDGKDSLERISTRIQGYRDEDHPAKFYRYVDNPIFSQRAPREVGLHIVPRYANWINSIYPDGSINSGWSQATVSGKTNPSGLVDLEVSDLYCKCNTYAYNVQVIVVAWNIAIFELVSCGSH